MNGGAAAFSRICRRIAPALLLAGVASCHNTVSLGDSDPPLGDPDGGLDPRAPPATLYQFQGELLGAVAIAVDETYLYLGTVESSGVSSLHRCLKANCAATLNRLVGPFCEDCRYETIAIVGNSLGLAHGSGLGNSSLSFIDTCTRPDCRDRRRLFGDLPRFMFTAFEQDRMYWNVPSDVSIYECSLPLCSEGPRSFAMGVSDLRSLAVTRDSVYWFEGGRSLARKKKVGDSAIERLEMRDALLPAADSGSPSPGFLVYRLAIDDSWIYALGSDRTDAGADCGGPCRIARWPHQLGGASQDVLRTGPDITFAGNSPIRVFQGELVFTFDQTYTCDADACLETMRPLGPAIVDGMAIDDRYLYFISMGPNQRYGTLQRVARLRR